MNMIATTGPAPSGGSGASSGPPLISDPATKTSGRPIRMKATQPAEHRQSKSRERKARSPEGRHREDEHEGRDRRRPRGEEEERVRSADLAEAGSGRCRGENVDADEPPGD